MELESRIVAVRLVEEPQLIQESQVAEPDATSDDSMAPSLNRSGSTDFSMSSSESAAASSATTDADYRALLAHLNAQMARVAGRRAALDAPVVERPPKRPRRKD